MGPDPLPPPLVPPPPPPPSPPSPPSPPPPPPPPVAVEPVNNEVVMPASKPLGYFQETSLSAAKTLATIAGGTVPTGADYAIVQAETQACRYRTDGTAPTASVGITLAVGASVIVHSSWFATFQVIEQTASAKLNVEFFRTT